MADYFVKQGDDAPSLSVILRDANNNPVNLTGASGSVYLRPARAASPLVTRSLTIDPDQVGNKGKVTFSWPVGGLGTVGEYLGEFDITYADTKKQSFPNSGFMIFEVVPQLA